jgi:thiamine biosynthesis lipoprotein ApbE
MLSTVGILDLVLHSKTLVILLLWLVSTHTSHAVEYLSFDDALRLAFPHSGKVERFKPVITPEQQQLILSRSDTKSEAQLRGIYVGHSNGVIDGIAMIDDVIGRTEPITWLCVLTPDGAVERIAVMEYREPYGSEIRDQQFLKQFTGKDASTPVRVDKEIGNIGGATLSVNALTDRVSFMLQLHAVVLHQAVPAWLAGRESPPAKAHQNKGTVTTRAAAIGTSPLTIRISPTTETTTVSIDNAFAIAQARDASFNAWRKDAELAKLNQGGSVVVSAPLFEAISLARRGFDLSNGYFDPTIYPLLRVWQQAAESGNTPTEISLNEARAQIGFARVEIDASIQQITLPNGMALDLSGLAKGLLLDHTGAALALTETQSAMLTHGGSSWLALGNADPNLQRVTIRHPADPTLIAQRFVLAPNHGFGSAATNGRTLNVGGILHSHVINPLTSQPAPLNRAAYVIAPNAALADVLDTTLCLMPITDGLKLVESLPGVAALLWDGQQFHRSSRWPMK